MKKGIGKAHGKIILIGEHAVVYHQRAISLPFFETKCLVEVSDSVDMEITSSVYTGKLSSAPIVLEAIISLIHELERELDLPKLHFNVVSNIPVSAGMGSSAAIASAIVEAVYDYLKLELSDKTRFNWIQFSETIAHGSPSGIDALTTTHDKAWLFQKGKKPIEFDAKLNGYLIVGQTGELGNTKIAVSIVRRLIDEDNKMPLIEKIGREVEDAYYAYKHNDLDELGKSMNNVQKILKSLNVSSVIIDNMVEIALNNNASGAKLTGGGLGGCVIAISKDIEIAYAIKDLWEKETGLNTWILDLNKE